MNKQITAISLMITSTITFAGFGIMIRDSQFTATHVWFGIVAIFLLCLAWFWLMTVGVETVWPESLSPREEKVVEQKNVNLKILLSFILLTTIFTSCSESSKKLSPTLEETRSEKMTLVQVVNNEGKLTDVFGDSLVKTNFYVFTKTYQLLPISNKGSSPINRMSVEEYLSSLNSMGNLTSDTLETTLTNGGPWISLRIFNIKGISVASITLL